MVAIRGVSDYSVWQPRTETTLDLRLGSFTNEEQENELISTQSAELGKGLVEVYTQASYVSLEGYESLLKNSPDLRILNLCCAYKTGDTALGIISQFKQLEELNLFLARNEPIIEVMGNRSRCVNLDLVEKITDNGVEEVLKNCKKLKKIDLSGTYITSKTLELVASLENLTVIKIQSCWNLKKDEIRMLALARPHLQIIEDNQLGATEAYLELKEAVKGRYHTLVPVPDGGYYIRMPSHVSGIERALINPVQLAQ